MHGTPNPYGPPPMPGQQPPRKPNRQGWLIVAAAAAALLLVGGLASAVTPDEEEQPAAAATSAKPKPSPSPSKETWEYIPAERQDAFVKYLRALDPGLTPTSTGARPRPLRRAVNVCWDIYAEKPDATVLRNTTLRYDGGMASVPEGSAKARKILAAVKRWVCSAPELRKVYDTRHP